MGDLADEVGGDEGQPAHHLAPKQVGDEAPREHIDPDVDRLRTGTQHDRQKAWGPTNSG